MITTLGSRTLLPHQEIAVDWMIEKEESHRERVGGLVCDEMGLGKTITFLGLCINMPVKLTLILCPLAVIQQWADAAQDSGFNVFIVQNNNWVNTCYSPLNSIYITNTDKVLHQSHLFDMPWDRLAIDEAHQIRNPKSQKYIIIHGIKRRSTWCLTATPLVNKLEDISALLHLINPAISYTISSKKSIIGYMEMYGIARSITVLPPNIRLHKEKIIEHQIDFLDKEEANFYRGVQGALKENLLNTMSEYDKNMTAIFSILLRLRQLSVHPQIYINAKRSQYGALYTRQDWVLPSAKVTTLINLIKQSKKRHDWVVFCQFHDEIQIIKKYLEEEDIIVHTYDGSLSREKRNMVVEKTKLHYKKHQVLLLQIQCGGTGLNLQHLDRVVFLSPWWTAALMDQAVGRVQRIGQKRKVIVHHLRLKETESINIDNMILEKVEFKRELCQEILDACKK
jgi:SNF2 family DNA or RNA helicase